MVVLTFHREESGGKEKNKMFRLSIGKSRGKGRRNRGGGGGGGGGGEWILLTSDTMMVVVVVVETGDRTAVVRLRSGD